MRDNGKYSEQSRVLRSTLLRKMAILIIAWTVMCLVFAIFFDVFISNGLGDWIADRTSTWTYSDSDKLLLEMYGKAGSDDVQAIVTEDGGYAVRDVSTYNTLRSLKLPLGILIYAIGVLIIFVLTLNRTLGYFDDLANAISKPELVEGGHVDLPPELAIASLQLEALQARVRDHEHAAVMAEQRKNELVAYLAHDIRTPLTSILGYLSLLAESPDMPREKRAEYAGIALDKAERLEMLVEEFFEITRYNLDSIVIERENVDVELFAKQVADEFGVAANERDIEIAINAPDDQQAFIDSSKMARALGNVLKNAVAYADPQTTVELDAGVEDGELTITVTNQGREISEPHLERIFERFYREDGARGQGANAGLGLAIAREIVEAHDGTITARSVLGKTTFEMRLPA